MPQHSFSDLENSYAMDSHGSRQFILPRPPLLFTLFAATIAFIGGLICGLMFKTVPQNDTFSSKPGSKSSASTILDSSTSIQHASHDSRSPSPLNEPLGLSMYRKAYQNPWSFSTLRTGVDELLHSYQQLMRREGLLPRVVVSFTSLPRRFQVHGYSTLRLLKQQSFLPDAVYIAIPKQSRRSNASFTIPKWIENDPLITVLRPSHDYGPATKLIPAVEEELRLGNTNTRIITVDDDNEGKWDTHSLLNLYSYSLHFEDHAIGLTGWNVTCMLSDAHCTPLDSGVPQRQFRNKFYNFIRKADDYACHSLFDWKPDYYPYCMGAVRKNHVAFADVLEGYKGVVYQPRFFNVSLIKSILGVDTPNWFLLADDVWFSAWLGVEGVKRLVVNPAIHGNTPIAIALKEYSNEKNISREIPALFQEQSGAGTTGSVEKALHSMTLNFTKANHQGVLWFENLGAWGKEIWKKPDGFEYPSEMHTTDTSMRSVLLTKR